MAGGTWVVWGRQGAGPRPRSLALAAQPGAVVFSSPCETCTCQVPSGPQFSTFVISCETQTCSTYCPVVSTRHLCCAEAQAAPARLRPHASSPPQGFEYQALGGQCCGHCVQVACVTNGSDGSVHLFYVSATATPAGAGRRLQTGWGRSHPSSPRGGQHSGPRPPLPVGAPVV